MTVPAARAPRHHDEQSRPAIFLWGYPDVLLRCPTFCSRFYLQTSPYELHTPPPQKINELVNKLYSMIEV